MKITAVTPPDAASDPAHPDHDRWVKETTLKMEVEHAKLIGLPLSVAEGENRRLLERAEQLAREKPAPAPRAPQSAAARAQRMQARGVQKRAPAKRRVARGCICGKCVICRRNIRVLAIFERKQRGDESMRTLAHEMGHASIAASTGVGGFKGLTKRDVARRLAAIVDSICDRSVASLGPWR